MYYSCSTDNGEREKPDKDQKKKKNCLVVMFSHKPPGMKRISILYADVIFHSPLEYFLKVKMHTM